MRIFLGGAEQPAWRKLLQECEVPNVGVSFSQLRARLPQTKPYILEERFNDTQSIFLDSGAFGANKKIHDVNEYMESYLRFVENNLDRLAYVTEFDSTQLSLDTIQGWRRDFWDSMPPEKFVPVWHESYGADELVRLCECYENVGITAPTKDISHRLNALVVRAGASIHGLGIGDYDLIKKIKFSSVLHTSWTAPMRFGDTIVWDGNRIRRYPEKYKEVARKRHKMVFKKAGFDPDLILNDDRNEVARFTVWSWKQLENYMSQKRAVTNVRRIKRPGVSTFPPPEDNQPTEELVAEAVATLPVQSGNLAVERAERSVLPIFGFETRETENGQVGAVEQVAVPVLAKTSRRVCDSCYVSASCPCFQSGATCSFDIPIELRTKEQLVSAMTGLLEMQFQRTAFGRFAEELEGGYPDPNLSNEMDRFFKMTALFKEIQDNRDFMKVTLEARGQAGVLSRVFGEGRAQALHNLRQPLNPEQTNQFLEDVIEGEVV
jgi:hypothetical protein